MGGFTVNGFGATDRFVPIRNLGTFQCPHCKQERMLQLMEVQRKVSLLYIQTVTINTKYAIACASCQNGYYIEEQQKDDILYGRAIATITEQGAVLLKKEKIIDAPEKQEKPSLPQNSRAGRQTQSAQQNTQQDTQQNTLAGQQARAGQPRRRFCGRCGSPLDGQTGRCPVWMARKTKAQRRMPVRPQMQALADVAGKAEPEDLPFCGLLFSGDKTTCPVCGSGLEDRK